MSSVTVQLDALIANPEDDGARRVYADVLLERGEEQGELIHVQLDLEREDLSRAERIVRRRHEQALLRAHRRRWLGPLAGVAKAAVFRRGFLDEATIDARSFDASVFAAAPLLRAVTLDGLRGMVALPPPGIIARLRAAFAPRAEVADGTAMLARLRAALATPGIERIEELAYSISCFYEHEPPAGRRPFQGAGFIELLGRDAFPILREALSRMPRLRGLDVAIDGPALRGSGVFERLESVAVGRDSLALLDALRPGQLRRIAIATHADLGALLAHPRVAEVSELSVTCAAGSEEVLARGLSQLDNLRVLSVESLAPVPRFAEVLRTIARAPALANLRELELPDHEALGELARPERLDALRVLRLGPPMPRLLAMALTAWPLVQRLELLELTTDARAEELEARIAGAARTAAPGECS